MTQFNDDSAVKDSAFKDSASSGRASNDVAINDIGALRALREVARHSSIASAAAELGVSQQALSARMRTLERVLGVQLLVRTPGGAHASGGEAAAR